MSHFKYEIYLQVIIKFSYKQILFSIFQLNSGHFCALFHKSKQGLLNHVLNMHSGLVESVKGNILKEYYGKVSTESNKICIYSVMQTERGGMS